MVDHDDVAGLLAAEIVAVGPHALEARSGLPTGRADQLELARAEIALEPEIGTSRWATTTAAGQATVALPLVGKWSP